MNRIHLIKKVRDFIDDLGKKGGKPLYELTPKQARQVLQDVQKFPVETPPADVEELKVPFQSGYIAVKVYRPKGFKEKLPVVFYIHGGGWILGNDQTHDRLVRELAAGIPAAIVFPIYTPSPEAVYPQPTTELFDVLEYIVKNADKLHLDASRLAVAGDSVGGNMAIAMALKAKEKRNPKIIFQLLIYPVTDASMRSESYQIFAEGPWLTKEAMIWFWKSYAPNESDRKDILLSPINAMPEQLKGLPPALIITGENDVLRDEAELFARKLNNAGVDVTAVRFNGTIHDFMMLNPIADTMPTRTAVLLAIAQLRDALEIRFS